MRFETQGTAAECGLACLAAVLRHHGHAVALRELRRRFPPSLKGLQLGRLIGIAAELGLQCRPLRVELDDLPRLQTPCVLHWNLDHYVVLLKVSARAVVVFDPARGHRRLGRAAVSAAFTGIALELAPRADFRPPPRAPSLSLRRLGGTLRGLTRALGLVALLSLALQVFVLAAPLLLQWVVDQVLVSADQELLLGLAAGLGLCSILQSCTGMLRSWVLVHLSSRVAVQWYGSVFAHLLHLPLRFFESRQLGDVVSRLSSLQTIQRTLTTTFVETAIDGLMAVLMLAMMLLYSPRLALLSLGAAGLYLTLRLATLGLLQSRTAAQLEALARQDGHLLESLRGIQSIKVAGNEAARGSTYNNLVADTAAAGAALSLWTAGFSNAGVLLFGIERMAVITLGATLALERDFSVGMLIAYLSYKDQFIQRLCLLTERWSELAALRVHLERLADIVLETPERDGGNGLAPDRGSGIEIHRLWFRYAADEPWIIQDLSLQIRAGESVALVGASGCGKTTLLKLVLGLLQPCAGEIRIGGQDVGRLDPAALRRAFGVVMQDDCLFGGSLAENIAFGDDSVDLAQVEAAARMAAVHEDIAAMPMGYHGLIGDMGTVLSGGQKQRVILARALYRKPAFLLLDEATSHLDTGCERLVNEAVRGLQLTRLIIAHRPQTIASADRVVVLENGALRAGPALLRPRADGVRDAS